MELVQARCPNCGANVEVDGGMEAAVCPYCGSAYVVERAIQNYHRTTIENTTTHYGDSNHIHAQTVINHYHYGTAAAPAADVAAYSKKSKGIALVLCFFLGFFGVHRFYLGWPKTGLLWLFTMGIGGIGWMVDLVLILCGGLKDGKGLPLRPIGG